jgi:hypothetical protein
VSLPWVRLDANIASNHKVLTLIGDRNYRAVTAYIFGLAYCGQHGTDGYIPNAALPFLHATTKDAGALVDVTLWHEAVGGWQVNDWREYQPSTDETDRRGQRARWLNCRRWHPAGCGCSPKPPAVRPEKSFG